MQDVPSREQLIEQLRTANRNAMPIAAAQIVLAVILCLLIDWQNALNSPIISTVAVLSIIGPMSLSIARVFAERKKRIEDLKETTRFGTIDKHRLAELYQRTLSALGLPDQGTPVFITADKSMNASALRLGTLLDRFNGIYLHRQVLHQLSEEEICDIMGHELGHYHRFYLKGDGLSIFTMILGGLVGLLLMQYIPFSDILGYIVFSMVASAFWILKNIRLARHGQAIEYLCDDLGAQVHGLQHSVSGLLKIGRDSEIRTSIQIEILANNLKNDLLSPADIARSIENATPYGNYDEVELFEAAQEETRKRAEANKRSSLTGFFKYVWESDDEDVEDVEEQVQQLAAQLNSIDRLDWESLLKDPDDLVLTLDEVEKLVNLIEQNPNSALFRIPDINVSSNGIHPPLADRIRYLWHNRNSTAELAL